MSVVHGTAAKDPARLRPRVMIYGVGYYGMEAVRILVKKGWPIVAAVNRAGPKIGEDLGRLAGLNEDLGVVEHALAPVKESVFLPYIFSHEEVRQIIAAASGHHGRFIWAPMLRALILVLYCTGVRLGEAVRLNMADVDLDRGVLTIQRSKGRARIVAIRPDLVEEIRGYRSERLRIVRDRGRCEPDRLFLRRDASPLTVASASFAIRRLLRELDMKPETGRVGARPYEFRHAFAVHRLTAWAIEGVDIHAKLPQLSAYLGHQNILGTGVYLLATPQLLELASSRFEEHQREGRSPP